MIILLISSWSACLIFTLLVLMKYKLTRPKFGQLSLFMIAGLLSIFPSLLHNTLLEANSNFNTEHPSLINFSIYMLIGPGMGEEFYKLACGLLVVVIFMGHHVRMSDKDRILGFVLCALTFAVIENIHYSRTVPDRMMIVRNILAVPIHGFLGYLHGVGINRCIRSGRLRPVIQTYILCALIHALYNSSGKVVESSVSWAGFQSAEYLARVVSIVIHVFMVSLLVMNCLRHWKRLPELSDYDEFETLIDEKGF